MIIPSIDLMDGKAVQLKQGKEKVLETDKVLDLAKEFSIYGEIAVIDLDAALGKGNNTDLIRKICKIARCRVGGGIRTIEKAKEFLEAGAEKVIIGTKAEPDFLKQLPKGKVIVAVDTKKGFVVDKGWTRKTRLSPAKKIKQLERYCSEFLFTNVDKEGLLKGFDFGIIKKLKTKNKITVAGGITTIEDIEQLETLGYNCQIGMALYTGRIKLEDAFMSLIDFKKGNGLVPTIVQDEKGQVLMLAYSNKQSVEKTLKTKKATYYSRSRKRLWTKGKTSGNYQSIIDVKTDCDNDCLLYTVKQKAVACHNGSYSCFEKQRFSLPLLYAVIVDRLKNPKPGSYTAMISEKEKTLRYKILEEADEVINYTDIPNLIWEIADLTYLLTVLMAKKGIEWKQIIQELERRKK